jgi:hypothetical protein
VLITQDVYNMIVTDVDESLDIKLVGEYMFSGIPRPIVVYQTLPESLDERTFDELRKAERVKVNQDGVAGDGSNEEAITAAHQKLRKYLFRFGPYGMPAERGAELVAAAVKDGVTEAQKLVQAFFTAVSAKQRKGVVGSRMGGSSCSGTRKTKESGRRSSNAYSANSRPSAGRLSTGGLGDAIGWPEFYELLLALSGAVVVHLGGKAEELAAARDAERAAPES